MGKKSLPRLSKSAEGLGRPTIMDAALAARHGVDYVHLAAFAIDLDRAREEVEGYDDPRPFGWEVFLTEVYMLERFDPIRRPEQVLLFEDIVLSVLEGDPAAFGAQIVFAIWDAIRRERFPKRLEGAFDSWEARPTELAKDLDELWPNEAALRAELAAGCLELELTPPWAPPTVSALEALARGAALA